MATPEESALQRQKYSDEIAAKGEGYITKLAGLADELATYNVEDITAQAPTSYYGDLTGEINRQMADEKPTRPVAFDTLLSSLPTTPPTPTPLTDITDAKAITLPTKSIAKPVLSFPNRPAASTVARPTFTPIENPEELTLPVFSATEPTITIPTAPEYSMAVRPEFADPATLADLAVPTFDVDAPALATITAPEAFTGVIPTFSELLPAISINIPSFTRQAPAMNFPTAPVFGTYTVPTPPEIVSVEAPTRAVLPTVAAPTLTSVTLPTLPSLEIPVFDVSARPSIELAAPSFQFAFAETAYTSTLLDPLKSKLLNYLQNGGYGMTEHDETRLFDRSRERAQRVGAATAGRIRNEFAASGFDFPPGALIAAQESAIEEMNDVIGEANRDITLKRADLYVENEKFTIGEVRQLETVLMNFHAGRMERALNGAKAVAEFSRDLFNALVQRHNAVWDAYVKSGQFFEARVRAETAKLERYKIEMEGKRLEVEINGQQVNVYEAQLKAVQTLLETYKLDIEGAQLKEALNRARLEVFKSQMDGYMATVKGKEAEFAAYKTGVDAETARMLGYKTEVEAFGALVNVEKTRVEANIAVNDQVLKSNQGKVEAFRASIEAYLADVTAYKANIEGEVSRLQIFRAQVDSFVAQVGSVKTVAELNRMKIEQDLKISEYKLAVYKAGLEGDQVKVQTFKSLLDAEMAKSQLFKSQVDAYTAQVQAGRIKADVGIAFVDQKVKIEDFKLKTYEAGLAADKGQLDAYRAAIDGEIARVTAFNAEVASYEAELRAAKTEADSDVAVKEQKVRVAQYKLEQYKQQVLAFQTEFENKIKYIATLRDVYGVDTQVFENTLKVLEQSARLRMDEAKLNKDVNSEYTRERISMAALKLDSFKTKSGLNVTSSKAVAEIYSNNLQAALNSAQTVISQSTAL